MSAVRSITTAFLATALLLLLGCGASAPPKKAVAPQASALIKAPSPPAAEGVGTQADVPPLPPPAPTAKNTPAPTDSLWIAEPGGCWKAVPIDQMRGSFPDLMAAFICAERKSLLLIRVGLYDKTLVDKAKEEMRDAASAGFTMTEPAAITSDMVSLTGTADDQRAFAVFKRLQNEPQVIGIVLALWPNASPHDAAITAEVTAIAESAHIGPAKP